MKMTKSRRAYKCDTCKGTISKGEMYRRKSVSIGSPWKPDVAIIKEDGMVAYEMQGIRFDVQVCAPCCERERLS
tara:strand:- start:1509 stop:1730 length:222 start_codon:yes stop_codon:yes gene_type:complete